MNNAANSIEFWQDVTCAGEEHAEWFVTVYDTDYEELAQHGPFASEESARDKAFELGNKLGVDGIGHRMTDGRLAV